MTARYRRAARGATAVLAAITLAAAPPSRGRASDAQCGPVGDPPATVQHGILAGIIMRHNPICFGGQVLGPWKDPDGDDRYACRFGPASASPTHPLPLLVFLHGSLATADSVSSTELKDGLATADLGGSGPGFILLAPEGRDTSHYYPGADSTGLGWDNWYRQFDLAGTVTVGGHSYPENSDAAAIDHFIDAEVATGDVDPKRIFMSGWSNGAAMAILYALQRPQIAAAAVYSSPDPFGAFTDPCFQTPVAGAPSNDGEVQISNPGLHLMHVRNACDIGGICPNGDTLAAQLRAAGVDLTDVVLDSEGLPVKACDPRCGTNPRGGGDVPLSGSTAGFWHHVRWPSQMNPQMFQFLKNHPLPK